MAYNYGPTLENYKIREEARRILSNRWGNAILAVLVYSAVLGVSGYIPKIGPIIVFVISGPMTVGFIRFFMNFKKTEENVPLDVLFSGFKCFENAFLTHLLVTLYTLLWTCLFIVPGIIAFFKYSQALFIIADDPEIGASEAISMSKDMMDGYKWKFFLLNLSFIGWAILSIITFGIGFLWLTPYMQLSFVIFYFDLRYSSTSNTKSLEE